MKITKKQLKRIILEITGDIIHDPGSAKRQSKHSSEAIDTKKIDQHLTKVGLKEIFDQMNIPYNADKASSGQPLAVRGLVKFLKQDVSTFTAEDLTKKEYMMLGHFCRECYNVLEEKMPSSGPFTKPALRSKEEEELDRLIPKGPHQSTPQSRDDMVITPAIPSLQDKAIAKAYDKGLISSLKFIKPKAGQDYPSIRVKGYSAYDYIGKRLGVQVGKFSNKDAIKKASGSDEKAILHGLSRFLGRFKIEKTGHRSYLIEDVYNFSDLTQKGLPDIEKTQTSGLLGIFDLLMDYSMNRINMSHYRSVRIALGSNTYFKPYKVRLEITI